MKAIVKTPICPLLAGPDPAARELADEALHGMVVEVTGPAVGELVPVRTHYRYEGYAPLSHLAAGEEGAAAWLSLPKRVVLHKNFCDVLEAPKYQAWTVDTLPRGALVAPLGEPEGGWQRVRLADGREGYTRCGWLGEHHATPPDLPESELRQKVMEMALLYRGAPYRWGGKSPAGIDCSGLVSMAYLLCGIHIYRDAKILEGFPVHEIPREEMKPADLLFFPGHVALYLGEGRYCHSTGKAGDDGFAFNSLDPAAPDFREDLLEKLSAVGSIF